MWDDAGRPFINGLRCHICGKEVLKDGFCDIFDIDDEEAVAGCPICGECLRKQEDESIK